MLIWQTAVNKVYATLSTYETMLAEHKEHYEDFIN